MIISVLMQSLVLIISSSLSLLGIQAQHDPSVPPPAGSASEAGRVSAGPLDGMEFAYIPSGSFMMGSPSSEEDRSDREGPLHSVNINSFELMTTEVTQLMWEDVMEETPARDWWEDDLRENPELYSDVGNDYPVYKVSWNDCQEFIDNLNDLDSTHTYRLPSEAEWEYACRAGTTTRFFWGDWEESEGVDNWRYLWFEWNTFHDNGFYPEPRHRAEPVGTTEPNAWGLYDMSGNVSEWCQDNRHNNYSSAPTDGCAWESSNQSDRVIRGGHYQSYPSSCRSANRSFCTQERGYDYIGFRLARSPS